MILHLAIKKSNTFAKTIPNNKIKVIGRTKTVKRKYIFLIFFSLLLSNSIGGTTGFPAEVCQGSVCAPISSGQRDFGDLPHKDFTLSSAQLLIHIAEEGGFAQITRTQRAGNAPHAPIKCPFHLIKNGKVIDTKQIIISANNDTCLNGLFHRGRHIYALRRLRI